MGALSQALGLIIDTLGTLLIGAVLLRFLLQAARADFYNPVSQALVKATAPIITPFRKFVPGYKGFDLASLAVAYLLGILGTALLALVYFNTIPNIFQLIVWPFVGLLSMVLYIYFGCLIILIIASWIAPMSSNPVLLLVYQLMEPVQSRVRSVIPPLGMIDISPIFIILGIKVLEILIVGSLAGYSRLAPQLVIGI